MVNTYLIMRGQYSDREVITTTMNKDVAKVVVERHNKYASYSNEWFYETKPFIDSKAIEEVYIVKFEYIKDNYHYVNVEKDIRFEASPLEHEIEGSFYEGWKGTLYFIEEIEEDSEEAIERVKRKYDMVLSGGLRGILDDIFDDSKSAFELTEELRQRMEQETGKMTRPLDLFYKKMED